MATTAATGDAPAKDPSMPALIRVGDLVAPKAPQDLASAQVPRQALTDLALKLCCTAFDPTTDWIAKRLHISLLLAGEVMDQLVRDGLARITTRTTETK